MSDKLASHSNWDNKTYDFIGNSYIPNRCTDTI